MTSHSLRSNAVSMPELGSRLQQTHITSPRRSVSKRKLPPGKGLIDWIRLCRTKGKDMTGVGGVRISVTPQMLAVHNREDDCWTAIRGVVYNITAYLSFHPGSASELMKGAGIDCTMLFDNVHAHVRISQTLATCIVGDLVLPPTTSVVPLSFPSLALELSNEVSGGNEDDASASSVKTVSPAAVNNTLVPLIEVVAKETMDEPDNASSMDTDMLNLPSGSSYRYRRNSRGYRDRRSPSYKLEQTTDDSIMITIETKKQLLKPSDIITRLVDNYFQTIVLLGDLMYKLKIALQDGVDECSVTLNQSTVHIELTKARLVSKKPLEMLIPTSEHNNHFVSCTLQSVESVSHNTKLFTFELPAGSHMVVPMGYHVKIRTDNEVTRSYTPVLPLTGCSPEGTTISLLIKLYSDGHMSQYLSSLSMGDQVLIGEPEGNFSQEKFEAADELVMLAAGTGFTPMMKLIRHYLSTNSHKNCKLIFFNRTAHDIYYKQQLEELEASYQNFSVLHVLSNGDPCWQGVRGRLNKELLQEHLPKPRAGQQVLMCGHMEFTQALICMLLEMDYADECLHAFT